MEGSQSGQTQKRTFVLHNMSLKTAYTRVFDDVLYLQQSSETDGEHIDNCNHHETCYSHVCLHSAAILVSTSTSNTVNHTFALMEIKKASSMFVLRIGMVNDINIWTVAGE